MPVVKLVALPFDLETPTEHAIAADHEWQLGIEWGEPRSGHPEGAVRWHVAEVLANIDRVELTAEERRRLRIAALVHDTFKNRVDRSISRTPPNEHGYLAARFLEQYLDDPGLSALVELHDDGFRAWFAARMGNETEATRRLAAIVTRLGPDIGLFVAFCWADNQSGAKSREQVDWFIARLAEMGVTVTVTRRAAIEGGSNAGEIGSDPLTGLPRAFLPDDTTSSKTRGPERVASWLASLPDDAALIGFDVRGFEILNRTHGHAFGDDLLAELARRLRTAVAPWPAFRLGADEFLVVVREPSDEALGSFVRSLQEELERPHEGITVRLWPAAARAIAGDSVGHLLGALDRSWWSTRSWTRLDQAAELMIAPPGANETGWTGVPAELSRIVDQLDVDADGEVSTMTGLLAGSREGTAPFIPQPVHVMDREFVGNELADDSVALVRQWYSQRLPLVESGELDPDTTSEELYPVTLASATVPGVAAAVARLRSEMYWSESAAASARAWELLIMAAVREAESSIRSWKINRS